MCRTFPPLVDAVQRILLSILLCLSLPAWSSNIHIGEPLPELSIDDRGELILHGKDEISYRAWHSPGHPEKVHVLQYLAATRKARSQTQAFTDRLEEALPTGSYQFTTVINLDDALWGTGGFVVGEVKSNKRQYPKSTMVLDEEGSGLQAWELQKKSSAIVVIDTSGTVLFLKQGTMSEDEIETAVELIRQQITEKSP
jgi:YtfJ family uncharacterized protein